MVTLQSGPTPVVHTIANPKKIQRKSRSHSVQQITPNWFKVRSAESGNLYNVNLGLNGGTCTCPWGKNRSEDDRRSGCTHVIAALNHRAAQQGRRVSVWTKETDAYRQHRPIIKIGDGLILTSRLAK